MEFTECICKLVLLLGTYSVVLYIAVVVNSLLELVVLDPSGIEESVVVEDRCADRIYSEFSEYGEQSVSVSGTARYISGKAA